MSCKHCGKKCEENFCCSGCEAAYKIHEEKPRLKNSIKTDLVGFESFVSETEDGFHTILQVEGMHCAACIMLIENALSADKKISNARVNFSTKRLRIEWQGDAADINSFVNIVNNLGYKLKPYDEKSLENADEAEQKFLLRCLAVAGFAAGNVMLLSVSIWSSSTEIMGLATQSFLHFIAMAIALPAIIFSARPFLKSALAVLKNGKTNMDVPISIAIILASLMSISETINAGEHTYFDSALMLIFFLLIGRYLDARAKGKARSAATGLLNMMAGSAVVLQNGKQELVAIKDLKPNMIVLVAMGENIPIDGELIEGVSEIDLSLITGETIPQEVQIGDKVFGGTTNIAAPIKIKVTKASEESLLSSIVKMMEDAEQGQAKYVRLADKAARLYTPIVHTLGALAFLGWVFIGGLDWQPALLIAITVLIITCPCALGLAVPVVQVLASAKLMKNGILLKSGDALEKLANIDMAVFDKTGTLTLGQPKLIGDYDAKSHQIAASMAAQSKHPLSRALVESYGGKLLGMEVAEVAAKGLQSGEFKLGKRSWCGEADAPDDDNLEVWLACAGKKPVRFIFADELKNDAENIISELKNQNIDSIILSGDRKAIVQRVAKQIGITEYKTEISPEQKYQEISTYKNQGQNVLMIGDGLNDAPALKNANISMSPSSAIDIAQNSADIVFQGDKLAPVNYAYKIAKRSNKLVKQNFALAVIYNLIAIPLAVAGYVTPLIAALAMSGSSIIVILNSFRLNLEK